ncbi:MAG TPA: hypothetical protein PLZ14_11890, partial [Acidovorax temperans]|nr:hypothetical protein [Acidovorax temperans]
MAGLLAYNPEKARSFVFEICCIGAYFLTGSLQCDIECSGLRKRQFNQLSRSRSNEGFGPCQARGGLQREGPREVGQHG